MEQETELLKDWCPKINEHIETVSNYMTKCSPISNEYCKSKEDIENDVFNAFYLVSDLYYRENFHSDIISFFLDTQEKHGVGSAFLDVFIQMLNKKGMSINPNYYRNAIAIREKEDRIDILIKSESAKRAIIIENKINNAVDMYRQIPRYYDFVTQNHYFVDAIVYIPLDSKKEPYKGDWTDEDKEKINPLLIIIPAYDRSGGINLVNNWLHPSILLSDNLNVVSTLRQYSSLIKKLNHNIMDTIVLDKFYNEVLLENMDNLEIAQSIRGMLNEMPQYLSRRIFEKYRYNNRYKPFSKVDLWNDKSNYCVFFEKANIKEMPITIDVYCGDYGYELRLFMRGVIFAEKDFDQLVEKVKSLSKFQKQIEENGNCRGICRDFGFYDEKKLYDYIDALLEELKSIE